MNRLNIQDRARILSCLTEGNSLRSTSRMVGVSINTVTKLLIDIGIACSDYQDKVFHNIRCKRVQVDEIWSFCYAKEKNLPDDKRGVLGYGDVYTWVAIDADTKLVPSWLVGKRDAEYANLFINDLASRMASRIQLTSDGHRAYLTAVEAAFGSNVDYAMLVKLYGASPEKEVRYSPGECCGAVKNPVCGNPDAEHVSTSFVERQNLTMRMSMRRFTRLTNGFSKKIENHEHAISIHYMYYNFCRIHKSLRVTPAMEAGITDHVWSLEEIIKLLPN